MNLEPNGLWEIFDGCNTFEKFCEKMTPHYSNENIPKPIQRKLDVIKKLITYSYYEYEFLDVALLQIFHTLELALSLKYKTQPAYNKDLKNLTLYLDWALRKNYISKSERQNIVDFRNTLFHPKEDSLFGLIGINLIKENIKIIDKLFIVN